MEPLKTNIHMSTFFQEFMSKFGLDFQAPSSIKELIKKTNRFGVEIMTIKKMEFPKDVDPLLEELSSSSFHKKFFSSVFFEENAMQEDFVGILNVLDEVYFLDEMELKTFNHFSIMEPNYSLVRIIGSRVEYSNREELICLKVPY